MGEVRKIDESHLSMIFNPHAKSIQKYRPHDDVHKPFNVDAATAVPTKPRKQLISVSIILGLVRSFFIICEVAVAVITFLINTF